MFGSIKAAFTKEVCPFCFEYFALKQAPFRCGSPASLCPPEPDAVRASFWKETKLLGKVLPAEGNFTHSVRCPSCRQHTHQRLCFWCHMELPRTVGEFRNYVFSVVGAKDSGKTHYIAVLIEHLRQQVGPGLNMLIEELNDRTMSRYRDEFKKPLYSRKELLRGTDSALAERKNAEPMIFGLTFSDTNLLGRRRISRAVTLVFFDTAGEDLNSDDTMSVVNKYIYRSDGIILLLDPLQLPRVRDRLSNTINLPSMWTETTDIVTRMTRLIREGRKLKPTDMLETPLAVCFSKFDAVQSLVDPQLQLNAQSNHFRGYDIADFQAINGEMQSLVADWYGQDLLNQVSTYYRNFGFFGLSALGCNPGLDKKIPRILPQRVEDPFLWLLHHHNLLKAIRRG